jgi:hypothetical protein
MLWSVKVFWKPAGFITFPILKTIIPRQIFGAEVAGNSGSTFTQPPEKLMHLC